MVFPARTSSFDTVDTETVASWAQAQTPPVTHVCRRCKPASEGLLVDGEQPQPSGRRRCELRPDAVDPCAGAVR